MKKHLGMLALSLLVAGNLSAVPVNITIYDGKSAPGYSGTGVGREDNETEPTTLTGDKWDLEAFGYDSAAKRLDVIGTYDFKNGVDNTTAGAVFLKAGSTIPGATGWTYAYVLNFANSTFALYNNFSIKNPTDISTSTPWSIYTSTANQLATGSFTYLTGQSNPDGFDLTTASSYYANKHNMIQLDLSGLLNLDSSLLSGFVTHTTLSCGNDELEGRYQVTSVPDIAGTIALLGLAAAGLLLARRKLCLN